MAGRPVRSCRITARLERRPSGLDGLQHMASRSALMETKLGSHLGLAIIILMRATRRREMCHARFNLSNGGAVTALQIRAVRSAVRGLLDLLPEGSAADGMALFIVVGGLSRAAIKACVVTGPRLRSLVSAVLSALASPKGKRVVIVVKVSICTRPS